MLGLDGFLAEFGPWAAFGAAVAMAAGGFAKGVVGFALPLVALSLIGSFLPYQTAVALLVVPILVSNLVQSLRNGLGPAWASFRRYGLMNAVLTVTILFAAQLVVALPDWLLFGLLGSAITVFGVTQLAGWRPRFPDHHRRLVEAGVGLFAGFFGGISGIWGPPIVLYLLASEVPKVEMVRVQSLSFLIGSVVLLVAHIRSGVLDAVTLPASIWLVVPTMLAMVVGYQVQDRLDQEVFRKATLAVLILTGLNLLRRAFA